MAMMPVGMSQICFCNWLPMLKVGDHIEQGQEMGYFLFGGSDIVMIFQKDVEVTLLHDGDQLLMGQDYAKLEKKQAYYQESIHCLETGSLPTRRRVRKAAP